MTAPFMPKAGIPQWQRLYDAVVILEIDQVVTNDELEALVGEGFRGPLTTKTIKELEARNNRTLISVRGIGYRMAQAREHAIVGVQREKKARRQIVRGLHTVTHTDFALLTEEERQKSIQMSTRLATQEAITRPRQSTVKTLSQVQAEKIADLTAEINRLKRENAELRGGEAQTG